MLNEYVVIKLVSLEVIFGLMTSIDNDTCCVEYPIGIHEQSDEAWDYCKYTDDKILKLSPSSIIYIKELSEEYKNLYKSYIEQITISDSSSNSVLLTEDELEMSLH